MATVDGLVTLFYDGSKELWNENLNWERSIALLTGVRANDLESSNVSDECKRYFRERLSWEQIIIVDGVTVIPAFTFYMCKNIKRAVFADTVLRIENLAFFQCAGLVFIKLPVNLEYVGDLAFVECNLSSVFIPPRCLEIGTRAFAGNANLAILNVPQDVDFDDEVVLGTKLLQRSPNPHYMNITWLMNINNDERFALHRVCSSFEPTLEMILDTMKERGGLNAFKVENSIGITPSRYLKENPYASVSEKEIIENFIMQMMGER